jgi:hypothetical protein
MANILLAVAIVLAAFAWRRTDFWLPPFMPVGRSASSRLLLLGGWVIVVLTVGFSSGDLLSGRTQVSKDPVRYATRLQGTDAHGHDLQDTGRFWQQVLLQSAVGLLMGAALIAASQARQRDRRFAA